MATFYVKKAQLEYWLVHETTKALRKQEQAVKKWKKFKSKLANMTDCLKADIIELGCSTPRTPKTPTWERSQLF